MKEYQILWAVTQYTYPDEVWARNYMLNKQI